MKLALESPAIEAPQGLYETHLTVADLTRSITFYRDVVGLRLATVFEDRVAFLWVDDKRTGMLGLWKTGSGPMGLRLHLAFRLSREGVLASAAGLASRGVQPLGFDDVPSLEPVVIGWMPAVAQFCRDPDGHLVEFLHVLDEPADPEFGVQSYESWQSRRTPRDHVAATGR